MTVVYHGIVERQVVDFSDYFMRYCFLYLIDPIRDLFEIFIVLLFDFLHHPARYIGF